jgi:ABC-type phosphate transport system substrate-binding protein
VQYSASFEGSNDLFNACDPPGIGLVLQPAGGNAFAPQDADLTLQWGSPADFKGYAAEIGSDELALVTNPGNAFDSVTLNGLRLVYTGQLSDWDFLGGPKLPLQAYTYTQDVDAEVVIATLALAAGRPYGRMVVRVPGPREMRAAIAADPGGMGFLPRRWMDASVREIKIEDLPSGALAGPLLALSRAEPKGAARSFIVCLEEKMKN